MVSTNLRTPEFYTMKKSFDDADILNWLDKKNETELDELDFGVVRMTHDNIVVAYNTTESKISGYDKSYTIGKHFFTQIAPCTNNFMVAEKYKENQIDETLPYIFTHIIQPTKVIIRLLKNQSKYQYLLVQLA